MAMRPAAVVLLSAFPEAHAALVQALRSRGVLVLVPRPHEMPRALRGSPDVVLVDLVHGTGLTHAMVSRLNRRRGHAMVVALHEGWLEPRGSEIAGLAVEGFCRSADWRPLLGALETRPGGSPAPFH
jgi:hypothetical protein